MEELRGLFDKGIGHREISLKRARPVFPWEEWTHKKQGIQAAVFAAGRNLYFKESPSVDQRIGITLYESRLKGKELPADLNSWILPKTSSYLPANCADSIKSRCEPLQHHFNGDISSLCL